MPPPAILWPEGKLNMRSSAAPARPRNTVAGAPDNLAEKLSERVVGQQAAMQTIVPCVQMFLAGLAPEGRPAGVFLLLGPTGTGKTRTVEALADVLHGSEKNVLRIDCGEFQLEHEVARLIGAPPGYLGHRETQPLLSQLRLNTVASENCGLSLVLLDEVEKAAPSFCRLLLGVLDKGLLRLGDNSMVSFERSLIFLTSNLGAAGMMKEMLPDFGFSAAAPKADDAADGKLHRIALAAVRKRFAPEFVNRIDAIVTYRPLDQAALAAILDQQIEELQRHIINRLGPRGFEIDVLPESRRFLLRTGTSPRYGARELKRTIHRHLTQPLAALVAGGQVAPGSSLRVEFDKDTGSLHIRY